MKLSQSSFTLKPNQSTSVDVSASDPEGLDAQRLPVWSGYVKIQEANSSGKALTVPYLGLAGSLRSKQLFVGPGHVSVRNWDQPNVTRYNEIGFTPVVVADPYMGKERLGNFDSFEWPANTIHNNPVAFFHLTIGTPRIEVYVVPWDICPKQANEKLTVGKACVPESSLVDVAGIKSIGLIHGYAHDYRGRGEPENGFVFDGLLESGEYAPPGRYKFVARALSVFGDADNEDHWQVQETHWITFGYESNLLDVQ